MILLSLLRFCLLLCPNNISKQIKTVTSDQLVENGKWNIKRLQHTICLRYILQLLHLGRKLKIC